MKILQTLTLMLLSYMPDNGVITTDKVVNVSISEIPRNLKEGDLQMEVALPFIVECGI